MKLENQVTNLELSKKLKELGVKQESLFWWRNEFKEKFMPRAGRQWVLNYDRYAHVDSSYEEDNVSAFTVAELINLCGVKLNFIRNNIHTWEVSGYKEGFTKAPTLTEALALFVIQNYEK